MMTSKGILIVDDDHSICLTLSLALNDLGYELATAHSGEAALSAIEQRNFGIVLLDIWMPGIDGMEVLRLIKLIAPQIRVIMMTAHGGVESAVAAMKLGAVDFIQKPFTPPEIRSLVEAVIRREALDDSMAKDYASCVELAKKCITDHRFEAADAHLRKAVSIDPSRAEAFNLLGAVLEIQGAHRSEALRNYHAALALDGSYAPARRNIDRIAGENMYRRGKIDIDRNP
jgi:DNA-binding NtrC family response regulator